MGFSGWTAPLSILSARLARRNADRAYVRAKEARTNRDYPKVIGESARTIASGKLTDDQLFHCLILRSNVYAETGRDDLAIADLDAAIRARPDCPAGYQSRAWFHIDRGNLDAAVADYTSALGVRPDDGDLRRQRALILRRLGRHEEVWADLKRLSELDGGPHDPFTIVRTTTVAELDIEVRSLEELDSDIEQGPDNGWGHAYRGRLHEKRGALREAVQDYRTAIQLQMDEAQKLYRESQELVEQGNGEEGETAAHIYEEGDLCMAVAVALVERVEAIQGPS